MAIFRTQVVISHPALGGNGTNTFHFRALGPLESDHQDQLDGAADALSSLYAGLSGLYAESAEVAHDGEWTQVDEPGPTIQTEAWGAVVGTGGQVLAPQDSLVLGWRTALPGRNRRGRTFIGPLGLETLADDGTPTGGILTVARTAAAAFVAESAGFADGAFCIWSTQSTEEPGEFAYDVTGVSVANRYGSLRSRRD